MRLRAILLIIFLGVLAGLAAISPAAAQTPNPNPSPDEVNAVARQLYCPVCENTPLDVCPTQACAQWRDLIRQQLAQGWTEDQIKDYFVRQYGDRVLAEPPRTGLNWLVYVLPPVLLLAGAYLVWRVLKGMNARREPGPAGPQISQEDQEYLSRIEEELKRRE